MGLYQRAKRFVQGVYHYSVRAATSLSWSDGVSAGSTRELNAMTLIPLYACVRILTEQISSLPLNIMRQQNNGAVKKVDNAYTRAFLEAPGTYDSRVVWTRKMVSSLAMRGNAYGLIIRRFDDGTPEKIEWLHPDTVECVDKNNDGITPFYYHNGQPVSRTKIKHIQLFPRAGHVKSLSPIEHFAEQIGYAIAATDYGGRWFEHGGTPPAVMKNTSQIISNTDAEEVSRRLANSLKRGRPLVVGKDWDFQAISITPEESQFLLTMRLNATQVAAIYGIPPEMVGGESGGSLTYSSSSSDGMSLYKYTIRPWLVLLEEELSSLLKKREFFKWDVDGLVRADITARYAAHQIGVTAGFLTVNEVRGIEGLPPVAGGDELQQPSALPPPKKED